jgi:hypothetical protein
VKKTLKLSAVLLSILAIVIMMFPCAATAAAPGSTTEITHFVSVERAKILVEQAFGDDGPAIVSRMITRNITPLPVQRHISYNPINNPPGNYGGYQVKASVNDSEGCFNVTQSTNGHDAAWTGVGGIYGNQYLAQTGVDMSNTPQAWTEILVPNQPGYGATFWFNVSPGDDMASVVIKDSSDPGYWYLMIADLTSGEWHGGDVQFAPDQNSAEWIVERLGTTIGSYGTVHFQHCMWDDSNFNPQTITSGEAIALYRDIEQGSDRTVTPGNIGADGKNFTMTAN